MACRVKISPFFTFLLRCSFCIFSSSLPCLLFYSSSNIFLLHSISSMCVWLFTSLVTTSHTSASPMRHFVSGVCLLAADWSAVFCTIYWSEPLQQWLTGHCVRPSSAQCCLYRLALPCAILGSVSVGVKIKLACLWKIRPCAFYFGTAPDASLTPQNSPEFGPSVMGFYNLLKPWISRRMFDGYICSLESLKENG